MLHLAPVLAISAMAAALPTAVEPIEKIDFEHLVRRFDWRDGLPGSFVSTAAQDRAGFLWVSGPSGVVRYDGQTFKVLYPFAAHLLAGTGTSGRIMILDGKNAYHEIKNGVVVDVPGPEDTVPLDAQAATAPDGTFWHERDGRLFRLPPNGTWIPVPSPAPPDDPIRRVFTTAGPDVYVSNRSALWRIAADGPAREVARIRGIFQVIQRSNGALVIAAQQPPGPVTTRVYEVRDGPPRLILEKFNHRFTGMAERGSRIWVGTDGGLFGIADGMPPVFVDAAELNGSSGAPFVDREGSMWVTTFRGLFQLPEPETFSSFVPDGRVARELVRVAGRSWLATWGNVSRYEDGPEGLRAMSYGRTFGIVCPDAAGSVWMQTNAGLVRLEERGFSAGHALGPISLEACSLGPRGDLWLGFHPNTLQVLRRGDDRPRVVPPPPEASDTLLLNMVEDQAGTLWAGAGTRVCHARADEVLAGRAEAWSCEDTSLPFAINTLGVAPSGAVWIATEGGVFRRTADGWRNLIPAPRLRSRWIHSIRPSISGGTWILGTGTIVRVLERPGTQDGFEIVEDLSAWHGIPTTSVTNIAEDPDGTLWFASDAGLMKVPGEVRRLRPPPPPVALIEASADGRALPLGRAVELPYRRNRLELRFAALSFRNATALRYRHRLHEDAPWSDATPDPRFRFVDLAPGRYRLEVAASLDGERWSETPAAVSFHVLRPWYLQAWFFLAAAGTIAAALTVAYRLRVRALLRLERQRTRIAMDLHDEVGAGLGTISVLAGIVANKDLGAGKREEFAARIAGVSRELSQALGDIVWSLRPGSGTLDAAWHQIVDRARPLFASGEPELIVRAPEAIPPQPLSVVARRSLFLLAMEALHNALKHAGAKRVALELRPDGHAWVLAVEDDGSGLPAQPKPGARRGLGLDAMRARAAEMDAALRLAAVPTGGTRVELRFRPGAQRGI